MAFSKLLEGVVFVLSGFVNPERATLRSQALEMGAEYQPDWSSECTLLVCAFTNTPKFRQVKSEGGTIVSKEWISECYSQKKLVDIEPYLMYAGKPWRRTRKGLEPKRDQNNVHPEEPSGNAKKSHEKNTSVVCEAKLDNLGDQFSPSKITTWALNDLRETISWLESQDEKPEENEIKAIAAEGIITCLQDAIESLSQKVGIHHATEQWNFVPQVVKVLMDLEKKGSRKGLPSNEELRGLATRCKEIYEREYDRLQNTKNKKQKVDSKDRKSIGAQTNCGDAGFDSDETIEMTEEEIELACKQLS